MKRLVYLIITVFLWLPAMWGAVPMPTDFMLPAKYSITPEGQKAINKIAARQLRNEVSPNEELENFSYTAPDGTEWHLSVLLSEQKICDIVNFADSDGNSYKETFDRLPYYACNFILYSGLYSSDHPSFVTFVGCWPTMYIYEQIFTYDGPRDENNMIPVEFRDYTIVPISRLANDQNLTNKFKECWSIGAQFNSDMSKIDYYTLLPNEVNDDKCTVDGEVCYTYADYNNIIGSEFTFKSLDTKNNTIDTDIKLYYRPETSTASKNKRIQYSGSARIEGFEELKEELPEFGDIHIFNTGLNGSEILGDMNPFTGNWGPYTALFLAVGDKYLEWNIPQEGSFSSDAITNNGLVDLGDEDFNQHANYIRGYLFADPKYSSNLNSSPIDGIYSSRLPIAGAGESGYDIAPELNSFVPYGYDGSEWSLYYGMQLYFHNFPDGNGKESKIAWGTTEGFQAVLTNYFNKTYTITSKGNIYYHYDPEDMSKYRVYSSIGDIVFYPGLDKIPTPTFSRTGNMVQIKCATSEAKIYYTTDGSAPNEKSTLYTAPIEVTRPCVIRAVAVDNGSMSEIAEYAITAVKAPSPTINSRENWFEVTSENPDLTLYFAREFPNNWIEFIKGDVVLIEDNRTIYAYAGGEGYVDSDIVSFTPTFFVSTMPEYHYNGRYITFGSFAGICEVELPSGEKVQVQSGGKCDVGGVDAVNGGKVQIRHIEDFFEPASTNMTIDHYFNGQTATTVSPNLQACFAWMSEQEIKTLKNLKIEGKVALSDIPALNQLSSLETLELENVTIISGPQGVFEAASLPRLRYAALPKDVASIAGAESLVKDCPLLSALRWTAQSAIPEGFADAFANRNLLVYVDSRAYAPAESNNIIVDGRADRLVLTDGHPFYCPEAFTAGTAEITRSFSMTSGRGEAQGWETIALPFSANRFRHETQGEITPFAAATPADKPFWLYSLSSAGWEAATEIEAYTPYIISMPNNDLYADQYNLGGKVRIYAENATVPVSTENSAAYGSRRFHTAMMPLASDASIFNLNDATLSGGYRPGSVFIPALRDVRPLEGYMTTSAAERVIRIFDDISHVDPLPAFGDDGLTVRTSDGAIIIASVTDREVSVYDATGRLITRRSIAAGEEIRIDSLMHGVYFVNGIKVMI